LEELLAILVVLGIVLVIVTVLGHSIWLILAAIVRACSSSPKQEKPRDACPRCWSLLAEDKTCKLCQSPFTLTKSVKAKIVQANLNRHLDHLTSLGLIDEKGRDEIVAELSKTTELATDNSPMPVEDTASSASREIDWIDDSQIIDAEIVEEQIERPKPSRSQEFALGEAAPTESDRLPVGERARRYAESREKAGDEDATLEVPTESPSATSPGTTSAQPVRPMQPTQPTHPAQPAPAREALSRVLAAFMEERNIRWGELVGGMLIVGCSIALVISFWSQIAARPLLKFVLFNGISAALFGAGFYTLKRWQIQTTSCGLLIIATLLVPLNFLAIAAFTQDSPPTDALSIGGELVSWLFFSVLVYLASRSLTPQVPWLLTAGVMLTSIWQLVTRRYADDASLLLQFGLAGAPVACYLVVTGWRLILAGKEKFEANPLFTLLGISSYATLLPLALLLHQSGNFVETLRNFSPFVTLLALPSVATGWLFWTHRESVRSTENGDTGLIGTVATNHLPVDRTIGISIGVAGAVIMLVSLALAWPHPAMLLPASLVIAIAFGFAAYLFRTPAVHIVGVASFAFAWLVGYHRAFGELLWRLESPRVLIDALFSAESGIVLAPFAGVFALVGLAYGYFGRQKDAVWVVASAVAAFAISFGLMLIFGFARAGDPAGITWVLALYSLVCIVALFFVRRVEVAWAAAVLLLVTLIQGVVFRYAEVYVIPQPWVLALLVHASITACGLLAIDRGRSPSQHNMPLTWSALATSTAAFLLVMLQYAAIGGYVVAAYFGVVVFIWLAIALVTKWPILFSAMQLLGALTVANIVVGATETSEWYVSAKAPWIHPWFLQSLGLALAGYCLGWTLLRLTAINFGAKPISLARLRSLLRSPIVVVDRILEVVCVGVLGFVAIYGIIPGVAQELALSPKGERITPSLNQFEWLGAPHQLAFGWGAWALLGAIVGMVVIGCWRDHLKPRIVALFVVGGLACPLIAAHWETDVAAASALRWTLGGFAILASVPIWGRNWFRSAAHLIGLENTGLENTDLEYTDPVERASHELSTAAICRTVIIGIIVAAFAAMGGYVAISAMNRAAPPTDLSALLMVVSQVAGVSIVIAGILALVERTGRDRWNAAQSRWAILAWQTLLLIGVAPFVAGGIYVVADALRQFSVLGPQPGTWFAGLGTSALYGVPLAAIILALLGHALRERSAAYALTTGLLINLLASVVFLIELARSGQPLNGNAWITLAHINAIATGVFALGWLLLWSRIGSQTIEHTEDGTEKQPSLLLASFIAFGLALAAGSILWAVGFLTVFPDMPSQVASAGKLLGWVALGINVGVLLWFSKRGGSNQFATSLAAGLALLVSMLAISLTPWDSGNWLSYHGLLTGMAISAFVFPIANVVTRRKLQTHSIIVATCFAGFTVGLSIRALLGDPQLPWWTLGGLLSVAALSACFAWEKTQRRFVWPAAALLNLATSIWWLESDVQFFISRGAVIREFVFVNVIAAAITGVYSIFILRRRCNNQPETNQLGWHSFAIWGTVAVMFMVVLGGLLTDTIHLTTQPNLILGGIAWSSMFTLAVARLWVSKARFRVAASYLVGMIGVTLFLNALNITDDSLFIWATTLTAAAYALITSYLWSRRGEIVGLANRFGAPAIDSSPLVGQTWLVAANSVVLVIVTISAFFIACTYETWTARNSVSYSIGAATFAFGLLSRGAIRSLLQYATLLFGVLFAIAWGISWLPPDTPGPLLNRAIVTVVALAVMTLLYGFGLKFWRRVNDWTWAGERLMPSLAAVGALLVVLVVSGEVAYYTQKGAVPVDWTALVAVAVALIGLGAAALAAAVIPGRDPLGLSMRGRTGYVYGAEIILALLFAHIRVTLPWLFSGFFQQFWPLVVVAIAFTGVGFSEFCRKRKQRVLAEPLGHTAALLPLLPVLGFWVVPNNTNLSLLLLTVAALYGSLAMLRRSFLFSLLAVVAINGSLWRLLFTIEGLSFVEHPQLWLIPPAACMLIASYLNRNRLSSQQTTSIRYLSTIVIYVSSTADIFLNGVANAPWLPGVLAGISIAGIFAGIILRVRAFLFLGVSFLFIAILTVIWYAAVELEHTWIWWVTGIITGILIIALFGLFEKKRDDVLKLVEGVKRWDP